MVMTGFMSLEQAIIPSYSKHMANELTKAAVNLLKNIYRSSSSNFVIARNKTCLTHGSCQLNCYPPRVVNIKKLLAYLSLACET